MSNALTIDTSKIVKERTRFVENDANNPDSVLSNFFAKNTVTFIP